MGGNQRLGCRKNQIGSHLVIHRVVRVIIDIQVTTTQHASYQYTI